MRWSPCVLVYLGCGAPPAPAAPPDHTAPAAYQNAPPPAATDPVEGALLARVEALPDASAATLAAAPTVPMARTPKPTGAWLRLDGVVDTGLPTSTSVALTNDDAILWPCEPKSPVAGPGPLGFTLRFVARPGHTQREITTRAMAGVPADVVRCVQEIFASRAIETQEPAGVIVHVQLVPGP